MVLDVQDVINSVGVPILIKDEFIRKGKFFKLKNGDFQAYVGGFSVVFPVEVNGEKWAFRCWHNTLEDGIERIKKLSLELKSAKLPYLVDYDFVNSGIIVGGDNYPTTRMKWIEGVSIKEYICDNINSQNKLNNLAEQFLKLITDMHKHSFSHGDLQHGNIIVNEEGKIYLIDYDSFYCPKFSGEKDIIKGLIDYQHPARKYNKFLSEKVDYFSELIIYLSILAISKQPELVEKYKFEESECLLFKSEDYNDLKSSEIYKDLSKIKNKEIDNLLLILIKYLEFNDINQLSPFTYMMNVYGAKFNVSPHVIKLKDHCTLTWDVKGAKTIKLYANNKLLQSCLLKDSLEVTPQINTLYKLKIVYPDGEELIKEQKVEVYPEASGEFFSDFSITMPNYPIILNWNIDNATKVEFNNLEVPHYSSVKLNEGITSDTTFKLFITDRFGTKVKELTIKCAPIKPNELIQYQSNIFLGKNINIKNIHTPKYNKNSPSKNSIKNKWKIRNILNLIIKNNKKNGR